MAQTVKPFVAVHPGELIKDELESRGISQKKFSEIISIPYTMLNEMLNGKRPITAESALLFEAALDINAEMLVNMQTSFSLQNARKSKRMAERFTAIRLAYASAII